MVVPLITWIKWTYSHKRHKVCYSILNEVSSVGKCSSIGKVDNALRESMSETSNVSRLHGIVCYSVDRLLVPRRMKMNLNGWFINLFQRETISPFGWKRIAPVDRKNRLLISHVINLFQFTAIQKKKKENVSLSHKNLPLVPKKHHNLLQLNKTNIFLGTIF